MNKLAFALLALIFAGALVYLYYPQQAESLLGRTRIKELVTTSRPVYQWRDEQGRLNITDKPPPEGVPYDVKQYPLDANVMPAFKEEDENKE
jgi:hypothetical protein